MEKLYNNILLDDKFWDKPSDAQNIPYLINPPEVIDITVGRQLFVDEFLIEQTNLEPEYHKAKKFEGNPVLYPQTPWELECSPVACPKSGGVWYDEDEKIFKMWYEASWCRNMCYATSKNGIHWERPSLDAQEGTNIILHYKHAAADDILPFKSDLTYLRPDSTTVFIDYSAPKEERYKLFLRTPGWEYPGTIATSCDGIHFTNFAFTGVIGDRSTIFYNPFRKKWVFSVRSYWKGRSRIYYECDNYSDGGMWDISKEHRWITTDELDTPHPYIQLAPELYNVDCVGYESIMLGMFQILYGPDNNTCAKNGVPKITELMPMYSRDGYNFSRPSRESIINASMNEGLWDRGYIQSVGGTVIINGDELWIYYIGFGGDTSKKAERERGSAGLYCNGATGLAKLRRDGFVSMNGKGTLLTRKMEFAGKHSMYINAVGSVYAEIFDELGNLLGKSAQFSGDSTKAELVFDNLKIFDLNNKVIRIKFYVDGKLYSFGFTDANGDFGGAHAAGMIE